MPADNDHENNQGNNKDGPVQTPNLPVTVHAQYLKDVSFENPQAPDSLRAGLAPPKMDISINLDARAIEDRGIKNLYEVTLRLSARAERAHETGSHTIFVTEVVYAAAVSLNDVPEDKQQAILLIEVPRIIFPFARQVVSDMTQQGGYPPLLLGPVDFYGMFMSRFGKKDTGGKE